MATLKQVIKYTNANAIEATWVDVVQKGSVDPETGETIYHNEEVVIRSHAYADVQMQDFRDDVAQYGGDISQYEALIAEVEAAIQPPPPPVIEAPKQISIRQCSLQLLLENLLGTVNQIVDSADEAAQISWQFANYVERHDPMFAQITSALGKTEAEVDAFFIAASQL